MKPGNGFDWKAPVDLKTSWASFESCFSVFVPSLNGSNIKVLEKSQRARKSPSLPRGAHSNEIALWFSQFHNFVNSTIILLCAFLFVLKSVIFSRSFMLLLHFCSVILCGCDSSERKKTHYPHNAICTKALASTHTQIAWKLLFRNDFTVAIANRAAIHKAQNKRKIKAVSFRLSENWKKGKRENNNKRVEDSVKNHSFIPLLPKTAAAFQLQDASAWLCWTISLSGDNAMRWHCLNETLKIH